MMLRNTGIHLPTTLRFVESDERYSVYRAQDGSEVYLAHGTAKRLVDFDYIDLPSLWVEWLNSGESRYDPQGFRAMLRGILIEPEAADYSIEFCANCETPEYEDEVYGTCDGAVCESCLDDYWSCEDCEERYRGTTTTLHDQEVCERCRDRNYSWCDSCEGYYHHDCYDEHEHGDGCCESPALNFTVHNNGDGLLANDTRTTVTLPAGVISDVGIGEIAMYLRTHSYTLEDPVQADRFRQLSFKLPQLGERWQTKQGNYTKRLSRLAYQDLALKITPEVMSRVGSIARDHSTAIDFQIETTRMLNLGPEEFAHEESCWWQSYYSSRCALKTNGGFGLRTFEERPWGDEVTGRAWVLPVRLTEFGSWKPTFETVKPDAFMVFNGYGDLEGYAPARIMSHMAGMTYRKVEFECAPMYTNSGSGYLVAPEEIAEEYTDGRLVMSVEQHSNLFESEKVLTHA